MIGKFVLLAAVCLSLAQGGELENAIHNGLNRAKGLNFGGQRRIDAAIKEVEMKKNLIQKKSEDFVQRSRKIQNGVEEALRKMSETMKEKAQEMNRPQSAFECIDRVEENANKNVESLNRKFETDIERLQRVKLENIDTYSKPLEGMQEALTVRYERAVKIISECKNARSVDIAVNSFARWLDLLYSEMNRVRSQVSTGYNNYLRDANNYFNNTNRQVSRIKSTSLRNMRECVYSRETIFEN